MRLKGRVAFVTGGAMGMGKAFAQALAAEGAHVVLGDVLEDEGARTADLLREGGAAALFVKHDVARVDSWEVALAAARERFGRLDVLVNNAGIAGGGSVVDCSLDQWNKVLAVNLTGAFLGCKLAVPLMRETGGGSIINISSIWGIASDQDLVAYSASKGGVRSLTKSAALHCAVNRTGVRVNSVHPGFVRTPMVEKGVGALAEADARAYAARTFERVPMGRLGEPEEIAGAVVFLASDDSRFMTGSEIVVDGGQLCH